MNVLRGHGFTRCPAISLHSNLTTASAHPRFSLDSLVSNWFSLHASSGRVAWLLFPVRSLSHVQSFVTPWTVAHQASLSFTISLSFLRLMSTESVIPSNHLTLCRPLLLLPSIFPSIRVFSNESAVHIRWPKYWSFIFIFSPSSEYSGLISFRIDWFDLLESKGLSRALSSTSVGKYHLVIATNSYMFDLQAS